MLRIFLALWFAFAPAFAWAGSMTLLGVGKVGATAASNWCTLIPQSGLINCWPYDTANTTTGTATDVIGGKNSTQTAVTLNGSGPSSNLNNAAVFNGTTSKGDTTLATLPGSAFTVVMWLNAGSATLNSNARPFANSHTDFTSGPGFELQFSNGSGNITKMWLGDSSADTVSASTPALTANTWSMVTYTYSGTTFTPYLNTTAGTPVAWNFVVGNPGVNISFGYNPSYGGDFYGGLISGTAIYNRALTPTEIATINGL